MSDHPDVLDEILGDLMLEVQENMLNRLKEKNYDMPGEMARDIKTVSKAKKQILSHYRSVEEIEAAMPEKYDLEYVADKHGAQSTAARLAEGYNQALDDVRKALGLEG